MPLAHFDDIAGGQGRFGAGAEAARPAAEGADDQESRGSSAIGETARDGGGGQHGHAGLERISAGAVDFTQDIKRPVATDFDGDCGMGEQASAGEAGGDALCQRVWREAGCIDGFEEWNSDMAISGDAVAGAELFLAEHGDADFIAGAEPVGA